MDVLLTLLRILHLNDAFNFYVLKCIQCKRHNSFTSIQNTVWLFQVNFKAQQAANGHSTPTKRTASRWMGTPKRIQEAKTYEAFSAPRIGLQ